MVRKWVVAMLVGGSIAIGSMINPISGLILIPATLLGAWGHEVAHYCPLKRWGEDLYIEVWPFMELRPGEPKDAFGHVGGEISKDIPLNVVRFSMLAPPIVFGWIPIVFFALQGIPDVSQPIAFAQGVISSPLHFFGTIFFMTAIPSSPGDIRHFWNAKKIKRAGSLDMEVWKDS